MRLRDLNTLPKVRDSLSYLYVEHCKIEQDAKAIAFFDVEGKTAVPCANLTTLMLGPGTTITHAAIKALADNGCLVLWSGEGAVRFYAQGMGETRSSRHLLRQAFLSSVPGLRLRVVRRMYEMRFDEVLPDDLTLQQIRGREGVRVRTAYSQASAATGVEWAGRQYNRTAWSDSTPINRALSSANSCLYGICHAAIVSAGYSPALGFIHTGKMLSFVYDIADLYKADLTIPLAFKIVAESESDLESRVRHALRDLFHEERFMQKIIPDLETVLDVKTDDAEIEFDFDEAAPGGLWDGGDGSVAGGVNWADTGSANAEPTAKSPGHTFEPDVTERSVNVAEYANGTGAVDLPALHNPACEVVSKNPRRGNSDAGSALKPNASEPIANPDDLSWDQGGQTF